jgi:hypothetical protein
MEIQGDQSWRLTGRLRNRIRIEMRNEDALGLLAGSSVDLDDSGVREYSTRLSWDQ